METKLMNAVLKQIGVTKKEFTSNVTDYQNASNGVSGFIYYTETHKFALKNQSLINNLLDEMADEQGQEVVEMVKGFGVFRNGMNKDELKDLYKQSDYIVKPEYLEWQIFFSGFYNSNHRGGSKETVSSLEKGTAKSVDLGMYIPVKGITREDIKLNISSVDAPTVNVNMSPVAAPQITAPVFTV